MKKAACRLIVLLLFSGLALLSCNCRSDGCESDCNEGIKPSADEISDETMNVVCSFLDSYFSYREAQFSKQQEAIPFSAAPMVLESLKLRSRELAGWEQLNGAHFEDVQVEYEIINVAEKAIGELVNIEVIVYEKSTISYSYDANDPKDVTNWGTEHRITLQGSAGNANDYMIVADLYEDGLLWLINKMLEQSNVTPSIE